MAKLDSAAGRAFTTPQEAKRETMRWVMENCILCGMVLGGCGKFKAVKRLDNCKEITKEKGC